MKCCPTCNRPYAPKVVVRGPKRQALCDFVFRHPDGVTRRQIADHVYADEPDGGPELLNVISVMTRAINRQLEDQDHDMRLRGNGGPGSVFKFVPKDTPKYRLSARDNAPDKQAIARDPRSLRELAALHQTTYETIRKIKNGYGK